VKTRIEDVRRQDLTEAAFLTLQQYGIHGATVARISARVGMSPGIVHHYFKSKAELLQATVRRANRTLSDEVRRRLRAATTPRARIRAIIEGNFPAHTFRPEVAQAWLSSCAEAALSPTFGRLQRVMNRRMQSNLMYSLVALIPRAQAEPIAIGIVALIDGLWLRCSLGQTEITRDAAIALVCDYVDQHLPPDPATAGR